MVSATQPSEGVLVSIGMVLRNSGHDNSDLKEKRCHIATSKERLKEVSKSWRVDV